MDITSLRALGVFNVQSVPLKERNGDAKHHDSELPTPYSLIKMGSRECSNMEHPDGTLTSVAQCIEQLGQNSSSVQEQE